MAQVTQTTGFSAIQRAHFETADEAHFAWQTTGPYFADGEARLVSDVALEKGERLLEIGCGEGGNLYHLRARPGLRVGVDFSIAKARFAKTHAEAHTGCADAAALPFSNASFDAVLIRDLLHHVPSRDAVLTEAFRVLRPGGRLTLLEPNRASPLVLLQAILVPAERGLFQSHARRLRHEIMRAGFQLESCTTEQPLPVERVVLHPQLGLSRMGALAPVRRSLTWLSAICERLVPAHAWLYLKLHAVRPAEVRA